MTFPVPLEGKAAIVLADVPDNITDNTERKTYLSTYNKFYDKCIKGKNSKPVKCAEGSHSAATVVLKKSRAAKAGARNSRPDLADIQTIHDKAFALGAKCKDDKMEGKALDLERRARKVRLAWEARFEPPRPVAPGEIGPTLFWVKAVFDDVVLVENTITGDLFRYTYTIEDDGVVVFEDQPTQVEMELVEIGKSALRKTIETCWICGVVGHEHNTAGEAQTCISQTTLNTPFVRSQFVKSIYLGNALKTISKTDDELIVANYMILFDGRDLEGLASKRVNADGTKGEFFTKATVLESDYTETGQLLIDWEHRRQPDGRVGPDDEDIFGYVDWKTAVIDDAGLFVRRVLNRRNRYVKMLEALFDAGMIGSSTEPVQKEVVKGSDGELKIWPLKRDSFSVQPMDWRMMTSNHLEVVKSLRDNPEGTELYHTVFNMETARAKAKALSLINQIGEVSYGLH